MDAVKAALFEAVKISEDGAARAVFEHGVEELGPQENTAEKPPATADDTEDRLPAVVHEHTDKETTSLSEENAKQEQARPESNPSEQTLVLPGEEEVRQGEELGQEPGEKPAESIYWLNKSAEESAQDVQDPDSNVARDLVESTRGPKESSDFESEGKSHSELAESQIWTFDSAPEGEREEQAGVDEGIQVQVEPEVVEGQEQTQDTETEWKKDMEDDIESKIQKGVLLEQTESQPDQDLEPGLVADDDLKVVEEKQNDDEQRLVDVAGHSAEVKTEMEDVNGDGEESEGGEAEVQGLIPVSKATEKTFQELGNRVAFCIHTREEETKRSFSTRRVDTVSVTGTSK